MADLRAADSGEVAGRGGISQLIPASNSGPWVIVAALVAGGGGMAAGGGVFSSGADAATLARLDNIEDEIDRLDRAQSTNHRMLRDLNRSVGWIVAMTQKTTVALGEIAASQDVVVDLTPPMLPQIVESQ